MKFRKLSLFLLATTAAGAAFSTYLLQENRSLRATLAQTPQSVEDERGTDADKELSRDERVASVSPVSVPAVEPVGQALTEPPGGIPDRFARFRRMMADPDFQVAMMERLKSRIERDYAGLFRVLNLDEEEVGVFKTLLAERAMIERRAALEGRSIGDDPEAALLAELQLEEDLARIDQSLAEVLGEERDATFQYYQETLPQRRSVDELMRRLSYSGTQLTEDRAESLVGVMAIAEESNPYTNDLTRLSRRERFSVTESDVALYIDERRSLDEVILSEASAILETDQLEALAEQQLRDVEQIERQASFGLRNRGAFGPPPGG